jgi:hypothetical protein
MVAAAPVPVPVPLPNPFGVYREWVGAKSEKELFKTFGWLWFIQEVRQATRQWSENEINE